MQGHRGRTNGRSRDNGLSDVVHSTHHTCNGLVKATEFRLSSQSKFIDLAKNNLLTQLLLLTATLKFCLKLSEFNTVVSRFIRQRLKVCKGFITEPTVIRKGLHVDFFGILVGVVLSLQLRVLSLKSRDGSLIVVTKETTKDTTAVTSVIEETKGRTSDTKTET
nr:MAG TPA_asm: hypothetical protein [Bacteriophage sp.]